MNVTMRLQDCKAIIVEYIFQKIGFAFILLMKLRNSSMVFQMGENIKEYN